MIRALHFDDMPADVPLFEELRSEHRRKEKQAVWTLLRQWVPDTTVEHREDGSPFLVHFVPEVDAIYPLPSLSISHTRDCAVILLGKPEERVGIDIECRTERVEKVRSRFLRPDEKAPDLNYLLLHWCAKEAFYKLLEDDVPDFLEHMRVKNIVPRYLSAEDCNLTETLHDDSPQAFTLCIEALHKVPHPHSMLRGLITSGHCVVYSQPCD